jgi:hypothetical protein
MGTLLSTAMHGALFSANHFPTPRLDAEKKSLNATLPFGQREGNLNIQTL